MQISTPPVRVAYGNPAGPWGPPGIHPADGRVIFSRIMAIAQERPLDINIEISNFCAASCVFCPNSKVKRAKQSMTMELFKKVVDEYVELGGGGVGLSSMQSDLFSDKLLLERLRYLEKYKGRLYVYTTTYLVGASKLDDAQLEYFLRNVNSLQISLGGTDKDDYQEMYGINAFELVRDQLLRIKKIVENNNLDLRLSLYFRIADAAKVQSSSLVRELGSRFKMEEVRDSFFSWGGIISQDDLPAGAKLFKTDNTSKRTDCAATWASLSVGVDGTVVGCGCVDWNSRHPVGNVSSHSIKEVWQSKKALEFRQGFSSNNIPDLCKDCSLYYPIDAAFSRPDLSNYRPIDGLWYEHS